MKKLLTGQAVLKCYLDLGPSYTVLSHRTPSLDGEHLCQVILILDLAKFCTALFIMAVDNHTKFHVILT